MENVTVISMHATYGFAAFLFFAALAWKAFLRPRDHRVPPPTSFGKVSVEIYQRLDLLVAGVIIGFYYLMILLNSMVARDVKNLEITAPDLIFNMGLQFFLAGLVTIMVVGRMSPGQWLGLRWEKWRWVFLIAPATVLTMWAIFSAYFAVGYQELMEHFEVKQVQETVELFQNTTDISVLVLMAFMAVIVAPICEEMVFRGYIYPALSKFTGPWIGWIISALVFSAAHGSMSALVPLFIFGLALVLLYEWTGSIWAPIAVHLLFNGATVAVQLLDRFGYIPEKVLE
jgi:membrane protease YdiL (CAAX protease family)